MDTGAVSSGVIATSVDPTAGFGSLIGLDFGVGRLVGSDAATVSGWSVAWADTGADSLTAFISLETSELVGASGSVVPKKLADDVESGVFELSCFSSVKVSTPSATEGLVFS